MTAAWAARTKTWILISGLLLCAHANSSYAKKGLFRNTDGVDRKIKVIPGGRIDDERLFMTVRQILITNDVAIDKVLPENLLPKHLLLIKDRARRGVQIFLPDKNQNLLIVTDEKGHPKINKNGDWDIHFVSDGDNEPTDFFLSNRPAPKKSLKK